MLRDRPRRCPPPRAHRRSNTAARAAASEFVRARETACRGPPSRWEGRTPMRAWPDATKRVCPPRAALPDRSAPLLPSAFMRQGTRVEVRARFDDRWARGFEVAEVVDEGDAARYKLRRRSDGSVLPALFVDDELREEKKRSMWWIA